jgi:hypothetical protein
VRREISDALVGIGFVLLEVALIFDWVSSTSGELKYGNSPFYAIVLLLDVLFAHSSLQVDNYFALVVSLVSVVAYLAAVVLSIVSWWRRWASALAGASALVSVVAWLLLSFVFSPTSHVEIEGGLLVAILGGMLLLAAYALARTPKTESGSSPRG